MSLAMNTKVSYGGIFGRGSGSIYQRASGFLDGVERAATQAANTAQAASLSHLNRTRPSAPPRPGRNAQSIEKTLQWRTRNDGTGVGLNMAQLNAVSPHWIIQEIGTGEKAVIRTGSTARPVGRPAEGASYVRTVASQRGRRISAGLVFANGPAGTWSRPGAATGQQLYLRKQIKGVPFTQNRSQAGIVIENEIKGQHFVQQGAAAGFRQYRESVLAVARQQFRKG